jgi:hypothetical protein
VLVWFLQVLLAPENPAISYPAWAVGFVAELGLALWLLVKGATPQVGALARPSSCGSPVGHKRHARIHALVPGGGKWTCTTPR